MSALLSRPRQHLWRSASLAIVGTVLAALIGPRGPFGGFWAPAPEAPQAHGALLAAFVGENLVENVAFGIGLAILVVGRRWFTERVAGQSRATAAWLAAVWLLIARGRHRHDPGSAVGAARSAPTTRWMNPAPAPTLTTDLL